MSISQLVHLFNLDALSMIMVSLVVFIGIIVYFFSKRYLEGDLQYSRVLYQLLLLCSAVIMMVAADHLLLFLLAWFVSNSLLVKLMIHKPKWKAAKVSGAISRQNFRLGFVFILCAFVILYAITGESSITIIVHQKNPSPYIQLALLLILIGAMTQSSIFPFHRWLLSSLNSPTPVSAIMHAGLVNGGGFLMARFAPLYLHSSILLTIIFIMGLITASIGTLWKLIQNDVKRMLACSTMGQMGFMLAQCGLGLFSAAVAHLCWHGMFKAYLFLASGSAAQEKRFDLDYPPSAKAFILAMLCGLLGSYGFSFACHKDWLGFDTTLVLKMMVWMSGSQFALPLLRKAPFKMLPIALIATTVMSVIYGFSVHLIDAWLAPMALLQPQAITIIHVMGCSVLLGSWLSVLFFRNRSRLGSLPKWILRLYVSVLNSSQPHPDTITTHRNQYQYR